MEERKRRSGGQQIFSNNHQSDISDADVSIDDSVSITF